MQTTHAPATAGRLDTFTPIEAALAQLDRRSREQALAIASRHTNPFTMYAAVAAFLLWSIGTATWSPAQITAEDELERSRRGW